MRSRNASYLGLLAATLLAGACADFRRGPAADAAIEAAPVDDPVFANEVYPILQARCQDCHSMGQQAQSSGFVLSGNANADRATVVALVSPSDPDNSVLLLHASDAIPHTGGEQLAPADPDYATIRNWIASLPANP
jgi:hypothetical protein